MPKLKLYVFEYEGPNPSSMLKEALTMIFPDGMPAGATAIATEEIDDETRAWGEIAAASRDSMDDDATDLEPLDEPTEEEPPPKPPAQELPEAPPAAEPPRHTGGRTVSHEELERTVEAVRACDSNRKRAKDKLGISLNALYRRLELAKEAGLDVPPPVKGNPNHRAPRPAVVPVEERQPVIVPPRPRRGRPPSRAQQPGSIAEMVVDRGAVAACEDAIACEFVVREPQSTDMLVRRTKFKESIVREALKSNRFRKTSGGYALA